MSVEQLRKWHSDLIALASGFRAGCAAYCGPNHSTCTNYHQTLEAVSLMLDLAVAEESARKSIAWA